MVFDQIRIACGLPFTEYEPVMGGDISDCYCLYSIDKKYFLKVNKADLFPGMFEKEADGLDALGNNIDLKIPTVIKQGILNDEQYLLMEWLEQGEPVKLSWQTLGSGLAQLHQKPQSKFGWKENNYIGSLQQVNTEHDSWSAFYAECRIMPLVKELFNQNLLTNNELAFATNLCNKLDQLFPIEPPSILHGDLWIGNYMITHNGQVAIFDPAIYAGHREMDIGMSKLFGGFNQHFYDTYTEIYPLEKNWQERLPLTQLYPLLVHAILFKGHYPGRVSQVLKRFGN